MKGYIFGKRVLLALVVIVSIQLVLPAVEIKLPKDTKTWITGKTLYSYTTIEQKKLEDLEIKKLVDSLIDRAQTGMRFDKSVSYMGNILYSSEKDPSAVFSIEPATGAFVFNSGLLDYSQEKDTPGLPKATQAVTLAKKYLSELGYLPKNENELANGHVGGLSIGIRREDGSKQVYQKLVTIHFGRVIDKLPVLGVGSRIVVHLGENGQLVGLIRNWVEVQKGTQKTMALSELRTDKEIRSAILEQIKTDLSTAKKVNVSKAELVLYDDGHGVIEPAIYVEALSEFESIDPKSRKAQPYNVPYDCYVPVIKSPKAYYSSLAQLDKSKIPAPESGSKKSSVSGTAD